MPNQQVNIEISEVPGGNSAISTDWFGAVQTGFHVFSGFDQAASELGISLLRWPGGHLSETRPEVYGLDIPGLFDATDLWVHNPNRARPDLADSLAYCVEQNMTFSFIIPTARYSNNLIEGEAHLRAFLADFFGGSYGELPSRVIIELGNEYAAQTEFAGNAGAYGIVASRFAQIIGEVMNEMADQIDYSLVSIAVQMGISASENAEILDAFTPQGLETVTTLVAHGLPISLQNLNSPNSNEGDQAWHQRILGYYDHWQTQIEEAGGTFEPNLFVSAWTVGGSSNTAEGIDLQWHDYGLRGASVLLELFAQFSIIGVDAAAGWGFDVFNLNSITQVQDNELQVSHVGELFGMLSEALPGSYLISDFEPHSRIDEIVTYSYRNEDRLTTYSTVNQFDSEDAAYDYYFDNINNYQIVSTVILGTELLSSYGGSFLSVESRIHELPIFVNPEIIMSESGINISFTQNYQILELIIEINYDLTGSSGQDWISGYGSSDIIQGLAGDDFLVGDAGNDTLFGHQGNDTLIGGFGSDYLFGGDGDDSLNGGDGDDFINGGLGLDTLVGGEGNDIFSIMLGANGTVVTDFVLGTDTVDISDVLFSASTIRLVSSSGEIYLGSTVNLGTGDTFEISVWASGADFVISITNNFGTNLSNFTLVGISVTELEDNLFAVLDFGGDFLLIESPEELPLFWNIETSFHLEYIELSQYEDSGQVLLDDFGVRGEVIFGSEGDDDIYGTLGYDEIFSGAGADQISGGDGGDYLVGSDGQDTLFGEYGSDFLRGGLGDDLLVGGAGYDYLLGGDGNDVIIGGRDDDALGGERGNDLFVFFSMDDLSQDEILDFEINIDYIAIFDSTWESIIIFDSGDDCIVEYGYENTILIRGISSDEMSYEHFIFL